MNLISRIIILFFLLISLPVYSQNLDEWYNSFKMDSEKEYNTFRDKANKDYADFIRASWEFYEASPAMSKPNEEPIPPVIYKEEQEEREDENILIDNPITIPLPEPQPKPIEPIKPQPQPIKSFCQFSFFNTYCEVSIPRNLINLGSIDNEELANAWETLSNGEFDATLYDCLQLRDKMQLCDWAYLLLLKELSISAYKALNNESVLLTAWLYCQSGYQMRLANDGNKLHMLYASQYTIYNQSYYQLDGFNYYSLLPISDKLQICSAAFENEQALSLQVSIYPTLKETTSQTRNLQSERYKNLKVSVRVNKNLIDFYDTYPSSELNSNPLTRWAMYANTPLTDNVKRDLYPTLKHQIQNLSNRQAIEQLLNFVQTAFVYEYDDKVWGGDRALFAEETLYYPYADCEDRSILFSRLVRDLLNLPVVLVYYPGHLATAVAFQTAEQGDYIMLDGKRFTICDPTYIGAPVGATMPKMENKTAKVILLE